MSAVPKGAVYDHVKRAMDIGGAIAGLIATLPVLVLVSVMVAVRLGNPIIFRQARPGKNGEVFRVYKFRTMKSIDPSNGLVTDVERLTSFGRALRACSLDELPTLINVLKGEMSIVGPRPLLVQYLNRYSVEQARRHEVRPGITGLAQSTGRNALSWNDKFALDVYYVDHRSFSLDLKIISMTVVSVLAREGISSAGHATAAEFMGSPRPARML